MTKPANQNLLFCKSEQELWDTIEQSSPYAFGGSEFDNE